MKPRVVLSNKWGFDKKVGPATFINLAQLITIVWFGSSFYTQVNINQTHNEERFQQFAEQRKIQGDQMVKLQDAQDQLLIQLTTLSDHQQSTTEALKDIRDLLREKHK